MQDASQLLTQKLGVTCCSQTAAATCRWPTAAATFHIRVSGPARRRLLRRAPHTLLTI